MPRLEVDPRDGRLRWRLGGDAVRDGDELEVLLAAGGWLRGGFAHDGQAGSPPRLVVLLGALEPVAGSLSLPWRAELRWAPGGRRSRGPEFQPLLVVRAELRDNQRVEVLLGGDLIVRGRVRLAGGRVALVPDSEVPALELAAGALVRALP